MESYLWPTNNEYQYLGANASSKKNKHVKKLWLYVIPNKANRKSSQSVIFLCLFSGVTNSKQFGKYKRRR